MRRSLSKTCMCLGSDSQYRRTGGGGDLDEASEKRNAAAKTRPTMNAVSAAVRVINYLHCRTTPPTWLARAGRSASSRKPSAGLGLEGIGTGYNEPFVVSSGPESI